MKKFIKVLVLLPFVVSCKVENNVSYKDVEVFDSNIQINDELNFSFLNEKLSSSLYKDSYLSLKDNNYSSSNNKIYSPICFLIDYLSLGFSSNKEDFYSSYNFSSIDETKEMYNSLVSLFNSKLYEENELVSDFKNYNFYFISPIEDKNKDLDISYLETLNKTLNIASFANNKANNKVSSAEYINEIIKDKTNIDLGKDQYQFEEPYAFAINALNIEDSFKNEKEIKKEKFNNLNGSVTNNKDYVYIKTSILYKASLDDINATAYKFNINNTSLIYVVNNNGNINGIDISSLDLSNVKFELITTNIKDHGFEVYLPSFKLDSQNSTTSIDEVFASHKIDTNTLFKKVVKNNTLLASYSTMITKQFNEFEFNEKGVKGKSVTILGPSGGVDETIYDQKFIIDSPHYLFSVLNDDYNTPIFSMKITNLE